MKDLPFRQIILYLHGGLVESDPGVIGPCGRGRRRSSSSRAEEGRGPRGRAALPPAPGCPRRCPLASRGSGAASPRAVTPASPGLSLHLRGGRTLPCRGRRGGRLRPRFPRVIDGLTAIMTDVLGSARVMGERRCQLLCPHNFCIGGLAVWGQTPQTLL